MSLKRVISSVLMLVSLNIFGIAANPMLLAQTGGPTPLSASQIDSVFSEFFRRTLERFENFSLHSEALTKQRDLQKEGTGLVADAARYKQAIADHDAACKDRDWKQPAYRQCPASKTRLDDWKRTSSVQVTKWAALQKANQEEVAKLQFRIDEIDRRISEMNASLGGITLFVAPKQCTQTDASLHLLCLQEIWVNTDGLIRLQLDNLAYRYSYPDTTPARSPFVRRTESLLVGGTGWVYGYYVPSSQPMLKDEQEKNLQRQLSLAGVAPEKFVDRADYDMIISVAKSQNQFLDLVDRVVLGFGNNELAGDQFSLGGYSAANQQVYASLKGTQTRKLDCHSNGAMVCLNALWNGDVGADTVRLFGPQITPAALARWESLLKGGKIKRLEINLIKGDPIAPASYGFGSSPAIYATIELARLAAARGSVVKLDAFAPDAGKKLQTEIQNYAPAIAVNVIDNPTCREQIPDDNFACHDMALYQRLTASKN
jgi:hypothetical protein